MNVDMDFGTRGQTVPCPAAPIILRERRDGCSDGSDSPPFDVICAVDSTEDREICKACSYVTNECADVRIIGGCAYPSLVSRLSPPEF